MPTHYSGTEEERRALDVFIKLARASESIAARTMCRTRLKGLTPTQFGVLEALLHLGPLSPSQLAEKHLMSRNNLTVVIANLEKRGLVRREADEHDRRAYQVHLTESGREQIESIFPAHVRAIVEQMKVLTPEEQEQLGALLRRLGLGKQPGEK